MGEPEFTEKVLTELAALRAEQGLSRTVAERLEKKLDGLDSKVDTMRDCVQSHDTWIKAHEKGLEKSTAYVMALFSAAIGGAVSWIVEAIRGSGR